MKKIFLLIILTLGLGLLNGSTATADTIGNDPEADLPLNKDISDAKSELRRAEQFFRDSKLNWENRIEMYKQDPTEENLASARTYAKQLINQTIDLYDKYYTLIDARVDNITGLETADKTSLLLDLEAEQTWLQNQRVAIAESTENLQITNIATALNNYRTEKLAFHYRLIGLIAGSRVNKSITLMTDAANRIEDSIANLTTLAKDTTGLEALHTELTNKITQASTEYAIALEGFQAISNNDTAQDDFDSQLVNLNTAKETITQAQATITEIVAELKKIKASKIGGSGTLESSGDGNILISVDGTVTIATEGGLSVSVYDQASDLVVDTVGEAITETVGRKTTYSGFTEITLNGNDLVVLVDGAVSELTASGSGRAYLSGVGTYQASGDETANDFDSDGIIFNISS